MGYIFFKERSNPINEPLSVQTRRASRRVFPPSSLFASHIIFLYTIYILYYNYLKYILPYFYMHHSWCVLLELLLFYTFFLSAAPMSLYRQAPLRIQRLSPHATLPTRGSPYAAGLDLHSACSLVIPPNGGRAVVPTDLSIACPPGTYARIAPRSGLAVKKGIDVGAGVVDADYRGPVGVVLFNFGTEEFVIETGDRIAQLILEQIVQAEIVECASLEETERGEGGFGSTGVNKKIKTQADNEEKKDEPE